MRLFCNRSRNSGAWVAVTVGVWSATTSLHHGHVSGWWIAGVVTGMVVAFGIVLVVRRRCV